MIAPRLSDAGRRIEPVVAWQAPRQLPRRPAAGTALNLHLDDQDLIATLGPEIGDVTRAAR